MKLDKEQRRVLTRVIALLRDGKSLDAMLSKIAAEGGSRDRFRASWIVREILLGNHPVPRSRPKVREENAISQRYAPHESPGKADELRDRLGRSYRLDRVVPRAIVRCPYCHERGGVVDEEYIERRSGTRVKRLVTLRYCGACGFGRFLPGGKPPEQTATVAGS